MLPVHVIPSQLADRTQPPPGRLGHHKRQFSFLPRHAVRPLNARHSHALCSGALILGDPVRRVLIAALALLGGALAACGGAPQPQTAVSNPPPAATAGSVQPSGAVVPSGDSSINSSTARSKKRHELLMATKTMVPASAPAATPASAEQPQTGSQVAEPGTVDIAPGTSRVVIRESGIGAPTPPTTTSVAADSLAPLPAAKAEAPLTTEHIGAPRSDSDERAGRQAFEAGRSSMGSHEWGKAEGWLREAIRLDGSQAAYHAELGRVLMVEYRWPEAEAAFTAAVLRDVDNAEYRRLLKEARFQGRNQP